MLRSVYLLRCRTFINSKEFLSCRKFSNALYPKTFHSRALKYLNASAKLQKPLLKRSEIGKSQEYFNNLLQKTEKTLTSIYKDFNEMQTETDFAVRNKVLESIDTRCFSIVHLLSPQQIFDLLYNFYEVFPSQMQTTYFYEKAISYLVSAAENRSLTDKDIIRILFYMRMNKDIARYYTQDLRVFLADIKHLSLFEKCIVAECFVKSDLKLTSYETKIFEQTLEDEFEVLKEDPISLIAMCKALTLNSSGEVLTLKKLSEIITSAKEPWNFTILVNLLNLYARALLFEPKVIDALVKHGFQIMKQDSDSQKPSLQFEDIDKFLRSLCSLGLTLSLNQKHILRTMLDRRFNEYKQIINLSNFINALLSLHILQCWHLKIIIKCFRHYVFQQVHQVRGFYRVYPRLNLLLTQIKLELKVDIPKSLMKSIKFEQTPTMNVITVKDICNSLLSKNIVHSVKIECPIEALPIVGVTLKTQDHTYHVDVLDNTTCLKDTSIPNGYMNFKLRLISCLQYRQILINERLLLDPRKTAEHIAGKIMHAEAVTFHQIW